MSPNSVSAEIHFNSFYHVVVTVSVVQSDQSNLRCIQPAIQVICQQVIGTAVYCRHIHFANYSAAWSCVKTQHGSEAHCLALHCTFVNLHRGTSVLLAMTSFCRQVCLVLQFCNEILQSDILQHNLTNMLQYAHD